MGDMLVFSAFSKTKTTICSYAHSLLIKLVHVRNDGLAAGSVVATGGVASKKMVLCSSEPKQKWFIHQATVFDSWDMLRFFF